MTDQDTLHTTLLRLGGRLPDATLARARLVLADTGSVAVPDAEGTVELPFTFRAARPDPADAEPQLPVPVPVDLTGRADRLSAADRAAVAAVRQIPAAAALWRSWRTAPDWAAPVIAPVPVFVCEANGPQAQTAATVMRALTAAGVTDPLVEVYRSGDDLPPYQSAARGSGALLWTDRDTGPLRVATSAPGTGQLPDAEVAAVAAYLEAGAPVLATTARTDDVVEPGRGRVVPMTWYTDGHWVWSGSVAHYLRAYRLAPEPDFLAHIRSRGRLLPVADPADEHRALALLLS